MRALLSVGLLVAVCSTLTAAGAGASSSQLRVVAAAPRLPYAARVLGAVPTAATVSGAVVLRPRSQARLTRFLGAVADKNSPLFHRYLAPGQFAARFGPAQSSIDLVTSRLRGGGLAVTVAPNRMLVHFSGSAAQVEQTFGVGLNRIRLADGRVGRVRTAAIRLPMTIGRLVTSVVGLDDVLRLRPSVVIPSASTAKAHTAAKQTSFPHPGGSPNPCFDAQTAATQFGGLTDDQIANAYGAFGLYGANDTGAGQRIAVFELEPFSKADISTFDQCYFGVNAAAAMAGRLQTVPVDGGLPAGAGSGEALLDIEDLSAFAPGATIDVYEAPNSTFGALDEYAAIVNNDLDRIVSSSWGLCEQAVEQGEPGVLEAENLLFEQAAAQGQSVFASAGDVGSNDCNAFFQQAPVTPILSQDDPATQPYVVGVGGTTIDNPTRPAAEHVWNDGPDTLFGGAGGGGISQAWPMPAWQLFSKVAGVHNTATIQAANAVEAKDLGRPGYAFCLTDNPAGANQGACREVPDVSAQADEFTGAVTVYAGAYGGWLTFGGTSSAAPIWAALLALTNESATCQASVATANGVGFVSPLLYSVASNPTAYAASFNDITVGNNDPFGFSGLFPATKGYDMATGLGSPQLTQPNGAGLAYYLCAAARSGARPTVAGISASIADTSAPSTAVTITGTNFEASGTPDVAAIQVGEYVLPSSDFHVNTPTSLSATFPSAADALPPNAPTDGAGRVQVVVTLTDGESSAPSSGSAFTYVDKNGVNLLPAVTSVGPYGGSDAGGNTVRIYGSGFTGATAVTFGGVNSTGYTVLHDWEIVATAPAYAGGTTNCVEDGSSYGTGENAANDVCQTQVVVTNTHGPSKKATILPLYEGDATFNALGVVPTPPGEEPAPAPTEYDYFPSPTVTSISTNAGPASLASEGGDSVVTIKGTGFNFAGLEAVDFGDPTQASSQDTNFVNVTGTQIQIVAPSTSTTVDALVVAVRVQTLAGRSGSINAAYAGVPKVKSVAATSGPTAGHAAAPDTGGTPIDVKGAGFAGQLLGVTFVDALSPFSVGTQYMFTTHGDTDLTTKTVPQNPGLVDVELCTVTACSAATWPTSSADAFILYPPGNPHVDSIAPASGTASGGSLVTISGENLGCVTGVYFGGVPATKVTNAVALLDCGSTTRITVEAPPGKAGRSVPVIVTTVEGDVTGFGPSRSPMRYRYTHAIKAPLTVKNVGNGYGTVISSPAGVNCGHACSHQFPYRSVVKLRARAAPGSRFAGWSGACKGTKKCTVRMKSARTVKARFVKS